MTPNSTWHDNATGKRRLKPKSKRGLAFLIFAEPDEIRLDDTSNAMHRVSQTEPRARLTIARVGFAPSPILYDGLPCSLQTFISGHERRAPRWS
jgi:hypothetical protein